MTICKRSGLEFETDNKRLKVHPGISKWTTHKDWETRSIAVAAIDRGKAEGWKTLEEFEAAINEALQQAAEPEPIPEAPSGAIVVEARQGSMAFSGKKPWVARILGQSTAYGYERDFVKPFHTPEASYWKFALTEDGVYEVCNRNSKSEERRYFIKIEAGQRIDLTDAEAQAIVGLPAQVIRLSRGLPLTDDPDLAVETCWECGASYSAYGYVEAGNMCCARCR